MKVSTILASASLAVFGSVLPASAGLLTNTGFESGSGTTASGWIQGSGVTRTSGAAKAPSSFGMDITIGAAQEQRLQQNVASGLTGGTSYTATVDVLQPGALVGVDAQIWIQWFGTSGFISNTLTNIAPNASWQNFTHTATAPAGTTNAEVFVRLASGAFPEAGGTVYADNFDFLDNSAPAVPEPASIGLLGLAATGLLARRRKA